MRNVKQIREETSKKLEKIYDRREAENISRLLLEDSFGISRTSMLTGGRKELDMDRLVSEVQRLLKNEPIQYVDRPCRFLWSKV